MEDAWRGADDSALSSLRHDLRQHVAAGLLLSQVTEADEPGNDARARLATIHTLFDQIRLLVNAIGETRPRRTKLDLSEIVDDCVQIARVKPNLDIEARVAPTATAYGDPVLLRRAVMNVLDNAARAVGESGTIDVLVSDSGDESIIEVTDNGLGFGQAPRGSGQGMSVVAMAVRACHGRLETVSGPGPGTTVRMVLPSCGVAS